ncbi:MAG: traD, partial [Rickettsiaceae bacterium]|nr:traD [Rickettsiaceae bacterium]
MIGNSIRGGQILVHQYRMLKQILGVAIFISFFVCTLTFCIAIYNGKNNYDIAASYSHAIANLYANYLDPIFPNSPATKIYAFQSNDWSRPNLVSSVEIVNSKYFTQEANRFYQFVISKAMLSSALFVLVFFIIILFWYWYGNKTKAPNLIKGAKIHTASEAAAYLKSKKLASDFIIGGMPLIKNSETSHILVTGTTGSGKSNLFYTLLPQINKKKQPAIIVDLTGDMVARFYNPERGDIIFNPFDVRGHNWNLWEEASSEENLNMIAAALFAGRKGGADEMWDNASQQVFIDSVKVVRDSEKPSFTSLYDLISTYDLKEVYEILKGTAGGALLDPKSEKTAMSIRTNTIAFTKWLPYLHDSNKKFEVSSWVESLFKDNSDKKLFLTCTPKQRVIMRPLFSMLLDLVINSLMDLGPDYNRRLWLIIDELPALNSIPSLKVALSEGRKYGLSLLAGLQSMNQLSEIYGYYEATTMFGQFNTKFIFRTDEQNIAKQISEMFGKYEYSESSENISYGAHEMRDGVSFGTVER